MKHRPVRIGQLAEQTGLSIRTLRYYDEINLLKPSERTESGHRLYGKPDIVRLGQIVSLRALGFALEEIRACLDDPDFTPRSVIRMHRERLQKQLKEIEGLNERLARLEGFLDRAEEVSAEEFIQTIEGITMIEKYYTQEQLEELAQRREQIGEEQLGNYEQEWADLIARARAEMQKGSAPDSEAVQLIARRWNELIQAFTGGNPGIESSLNEMYRNEKPETASRGMVDMEVMQFMGKAMNALRKD